MELLPFRLCRSWSTELEEDVLAEFDPWFSLSCWRILAPSELDEMEASSDSPALTTEKFSFFVREAIDFQTLRIYCDPACRTSASCLYPARTLFIMAAYSRSRK